MEVIGVLAIEALYDLSSGAVTSNGDEIHLVRRNGDRSLHGHIEQCIGTEAEQVDEFGIEFTISVEGHGQLTFRRGQCDIREDVQALQFFSVVANLIGIVVVTLQDFKICQGEFKQYMGGEGPAVYDAIGRHGNPVAAERSFRNDFVAVGVVPSAVAPGQPELCVIVLAIAVSENQRVVPVVEGFIGMPIGEVHGRIVPQMTPCAILKGV